MKKRVSIGALGIIKKDNKFLMALRYSPEYPEVHHKWEFPGGEIEFEETPEECVVREVKEEVGVNVEILQVIPYVIHNLWPKDKAKIILIPYLCRLKEGEPFAANANGEREVEKVAWMSIDEIEPSMCLPGTKEVLESVLKLDNNA